MKKIIIIIIVVVLILGAYFLLKQSPKSTLQKTDQNQEKTGPRQETELELSENIPFNTNDNLDQAIEDLEYLD